MLLVAWCESESGIFIEIFIEIVIWVYFWKKSLVDCVIERVGFSESNFKGKLRALWTIDRAEIFLSMGALEPRTAVR